MGLPKLHRLEPGLYVTPDGRFRIERIDSMGEYDGTDISSVWELQRRPDNERRVEMGYDWPTVAEYGTKRQCVEELDRILAQEVS